MVDDYPMNDEVDRDAEMDDYDGYYDDAAMVDESGGGSTQLKEYDMEGDIEAEYAEPMVLAEPADGMITEQPAPAAAAGADIPILEGPTAAPSPADIPILPAVATTVVPQPLPTPPQPIPGPVIADLPTVVFPNPSAETQTVSSPVTSTVETTTNPIATSITPEPQHPSPPTEIVSTSPTTETKLPSEPQIEVASKQEEATRTPPAIPSQPSQNLGAVPSAIEAPLSTEEPSQPPQTVEETVETLVENSPTVIVPHVTLYYDEQTFILFAPHSETENSSPSLLSEKFELFVAPLNQFLRALRLVEAQYFPEGEDFVFGLEYPDLDLCIDENSKYATTYSLKDFCDALVACNHTNIALTLYQVTDFEHSLKQRLNGIAPEFPIESTAPLEPTDPPEVQVHIPETLAVQPDQAEEAPALVVEPTTQPAAPEEAPGQDQPHEIQVSQVESERGLTDQQITGPPENETTTIDVTVTEVSAEVPATELAAEVEEHDDEVEEPEAAYEADELEDDDPGEPVPADETQTSSNDMSGHTAEGTADESAESSATLESSVHGGVELGYEPEDGQPEDGQPEDRPDEARDNLQAEPAVETATKSHSTDEEAPAPESNEVVESQSQTNSQELDGPASEHDELDDSEAQELLSEKLDQISTQEDRQSVGRQTNSSPGSSEYEVYEEYEEYEEADDQGESTAYPEEEITHDALSAGQEHPTPSNDPAKTPPVSTFPRITPPGKRTLDARDAEDEYDYSVDEFYETDAKRARVE
ncbi:hypothetical protein FS837_010785 [Tulasnella sp. UAMH 9824]|nr:hypothetical protein FS837_010785 [Tulasnella sp. UAMH 9824]